MTFALKLLRVKGRASLDFHECFGVRARRGLRAESATFVLQRSRVLGRHSSETYFGRFLDANCVCAHPRSR